MIVGWTEEGDDAMLLLIGSRRAGGYSGLREFTDCVLECCDMVC